MLLTMCLLDIFDTKRKATSLVDVASIEYDFDMQAMVLKSVTGTCYYKEVTLETYERMCDSFNLNADFKSGKMLNMNSLGNFIKTPNVPGTITKEQWKAALARTVPAWDNAPRYSGYTDPFAQ